MNNDNQEAQVLLKASLAKTRLTKLMQRKPDFQLKLKLDAIDSILSTLPTPEITAKPDERQTETNRSILDKAKGIITKRKQKMNFDSLYLDIKKETSADDAYNLLIMQNLEKYESLPEPVHPKPPLIIKHKSEQVIHGYQMLPKVAINTQIRRKKETMYSLNQQLKIDKKLAKQQTLRELQQMKLPLVLDGITLKDLKERENIQKYVLKGEFYEQWKRNIKAHSKPQQPSLVQSFQSMNQYLLDSVDYLHKVNKIENRKLKQNLESLMEYAGNQYTKLKFKTEPTY